MGEVDQMNRRTVLAAAAATIAAPHLAHGQTLDPVKLCLEFRIYGGNAPLFYGAEKGIFKESGIDITSEGSSGSGECVTRVASGTHPFGLADASTLVEFASRNPDAAPKLIMPIFDVFPAVILSIKKKISSLRELAGLKLGTGTSDAGVKIFPALLALNKVDPTSFHRVTVDVKLRDTMLLTGDVDAVIAFDYTAIFNLIDNGVRMEDINLLYFSKMGFDFFGNSLIANPDVVSKNPDLVKRMALAVSRAWVAAARDRQGAIDAVLRREKLLNRETELARMNWVIDRLILTDNVKANGLGVIDNARVEKAIGLIKDGFQLSTAPTVAQIVDARFIPPRVDRQIG